MCAHIHEPKARSRLGMFFHAKYSADEFFKTELFSDEKQRAIYGDSWYLLCFSLVLPYGEDSLTDWQITFNASISSVRITKKYFFKRKRCNSCS